MNRTNKILFALVAVIAIGAGVALWLLLAFWLHGVLFGVRPFG